MPVIMVDPSPDIIPPPPWGAICCWGGALGAMVAPLFGELPPNIPPLDEEPEDLLLDPPLDPPLGIFTCELKIIL